MTTLTYLLWSLTVPAASREGPLLAAAAGGQPDIVRFIKTLDRIDRIQLINYLGDRKNAAALKSIIDSDLEDDSPSWAVYHYSELLDVKEALALCRKYEVHSAHWVSAFSALGYRKKSDVIDYVKEIAHSGHPYSRYYCYLVCEDRGWGDLLELAKDDLCSWIPLYVRGAKIGSVLGTTAYHYVRSVAGEVTADAVIQARTFLRPPIETPTRGSICLR
jgi:hypothetical protein